MKRPLLFLLLVICNAVIFAPPPIAAQRSKAPTKSSESEATLVEALNWLKVKDRPVSDAAVTYIPIDFTTCTIRWRYGSGGRSMVVNLAELDATKVTSATAFRFPKWRRRRKARHKDCRAERAAQVSAPVFQGRDDR
jgi:hypothetical protein